MTDEFDRAALESFLTRELDVHVTGLAVLHDGLNLSVAVSTAESERAYVLRRPNKFRQHDSFNSLEQEFRVLDALPRDRRSRARPRRLSRRGLAAGRAVSGDDLSRGRTGATGVGPARAVSESGGPQGVRLRGGRRDGRPPHGGPRAVCGRL